MPASQSADRPTLDSSKERAPKRKTTSSGVTKSRINNKTSTISTSSTKARSLITSNAPKSRNSGSNPGIQKEPFKTTKLSSEPKLSEPSKKKAIPTARKSPPKSRPSQTVDCMLQQQPTSKTSVPVVVVQHEATGLDEVLESSVDDQISIGKPISLDDRDYVTPSSPSAPKLPVTSSPPPPPPLGLSDVISPNMPSSQWGISTMPSYESQKSLPQPPEFGEQSPEVFLAPVISITKENVSFCLNHRGTEVFLGLALVVTLFLPDLWTIGNPSNDMDNILNGVLLLFFVVFVLEMVALSFIHKEYFLSTFFWMDMVGTLSILIDFTWTSENEYFSLNTDPGNLRAARIAKLGFRVSRMSKLSKLMKYFMFVNTAKNDESLSAHKISSKVGMVLSQRVALLIMTVIIALPLLTPTVVDFSGSGFVLNFDEIAEYDAYSSAQWSQSIYNFRKFYDIQRDVNEMTIFEPVWLRVRNITESNCPVENIVNKEKSFRISSSFETDKNNEHYCYFDFRPGSNNGIIRRQNKRFATSHGHGRYYGNSLCSSFATEFAYTCNHLSHVDALFDNTSVAQKEAWYSVGIIFMVAILLVGFTATFQMAVESLVVKPIARVMHRLKSTAEEVLQSVNTLTSGNGGDVILNQRTVSEANLNMKDDTSITETDVLEKIVDKLARVISKSVGNNRFEDILKSNSSKSKPYEANDVLNGKEGNKQQEYSYQSNMDVSTKKWLRHGYDSNPTVSGFAIEEDEKSQASDSFDQKSSGNAKNGATVTDKNSGTNANRLPARRSIGQSDSTVDANIIHSFHFDVFALDEFTLCDSVLFMFERHNLMQEFNVSRDVFDEFIHRVRQGYSQNPQVVYHTWHHACDVMQFVYQLIHVTHGVKFMSKVEIFGCLVSALAHDIGHLGVNNAFLINTGHQLAEMHNDISPLENMHIRYLFDILRDPESNIMVGLTPKQWLEARKQMIVCILNTDMAYHFENLKKLEVFEEINGDTIRAFNEERTNPDLTSVPSCLSDPKNRILLQQSFLHAADLNNPVKPFPIYSKWIKRITEEFFKQGEQEVELGLEASPNFDRETTSIPSMQLGFMEVIIRPYFAVFLKMFPKDLQELSDNLERNHSHYKQLRAHEKEGGVAI